MRFQFLVNQLVQIADPSEGGSLDGSVLGYLVDKVKEKVKDELKVEIKEYMYAFLEALGETVLETIYAATLLGGGILLILKVAGLKQGNRWASILFCANALIHFLLGGIK